MAVPGDGSRAHGSGRRELGAEAVRALQDLLPLPGALRLRGPLSLAGARLEWAGTGTGTFAGSLAAGPVALELDTAWAPGRFALRRLGIRDSGMTTASDLRADLGGNDLEMGFRGHLGGATLDRVLERPGLLTGSVFGDLRLRLPQGRPGAATAEGRLGIEGLELPGALPLRVETAALEASGSELHARAARLFLGSAEVELRGNARISPQAVDLEVDAAAPALDLEELRPLLGARSDGGSGGLRALGLPLRGTVRVQADALAWAGRTWKAVRAGVGLGPQGVDLDVAAADLCGVATPGALSLGNGQVRLRAAPAAQGLSLAPALACLWGVEGLATGTASLQAEVRAEGEAGRLLSSTQGEFRFSAADGRVRRYDLLARVFSLLNLTEVFRGNLPDLAGEGLGYRSLRADGTLGGGVLEFREGVMDASSVTLFWRGTWDLTRDAVDLTVLVAPFKTADAVVQRLPVLGYVLGDSLVAVPVRVTGRRTEPQVVPLDPSAVGAGLLGVVKRTLSLPLRVIQPLREPEKK